MQSFESVKEGSKFTHTVHLLRARHSHVRELHNKLAFFLAFLRGERAKADCPGWEAGGSVFDCRAQVPFLYLFCHHSEPLRHPHSFPGLLLQAHPWKSRPLQHAGLHRELPDFSSETSSGKFSPTHNLINCLTTCKTGQVPSEHSVPSTA